jgi:hypothetical protein
LKYVDKQELLKHTNNGLDIILRYYPQAQDVLDKKVTHFKIRDEKNASARLTKADDGNWLVTDFGGDGKSRNAIDVAMFEENVSPTDKVRYKEVMNMLAGEFGMSEETGFTPHKAEVKYREATKDEAVECITIHGIREFTKQDFITVFAEKIRAYKDFDELKDVCDFYRFKAITGYTQVYRDKETGNLKAREVKATEYYPMYEWDEGVFQKLYFPKEINKRYRFLVAGEMPHHYLHGLEQLTKEYKEKITEQETQEDDVTEEEEAKKKSKKLLKLKNVIICTGGSDAMNVAALTGIKESIGYYVVWHNSESIQLSFAHYWELYRMFSDICYLGDIDETGIKKAHELCLQWLDIRKIVLPASLKNYSDKFRKSPAKDVRDFLKVKTAWDFFTIYEKALPYRFWDVYFQSTNKRVNGRREKIWEETYQCNNMALIQFINAMGYWQYTDPDTEDDMLVHVEGNIVKRVSLKDIRIFVINFLQQRANNNNVINYFMRTLNNIDVSALPYIELNFETTSVDCRYFFFINKAWKITAEGIKEFDYIKNPIERHVWETDIIQRKVQLHKPYFSIAINKDADKGERFNAEITDKRCLFFQFLINTCRTHWRVELLGTVDEETKTERKELTADEKREQDGHLINRIFTTGYIAHGYRDSARAWAVFGLENKLIDDDESSGRSGKSLYANSFVHIYPQLLIIDARRRKDVEGPHFFENVTRNSKVVHIEDCYKGYDYSADYNKITGNWQINRKSKTIISIPFKYSPIPVYTSNFPLRNLDPSTQARFLYTAFADYYHWSSDEFSEPHQPAHDFGKRLFDDYTEDEWTCYYNTIAQCVQFFLSCGDSLRVDPPMNIINERTIKSLISDDFIEWADAYFITETGERLNVNILKKDVQDDFKNTCGPDKFNKKSFDKQLKRWCKLRGFELNPIAICTDKKNRYVKKWLDGKQVYYVHIKADSEIINSLNHINNDRPKEAETKQKAGEETDTLNF